MQKLNRHIFSGNGYYDAAAAAAAEVSWYTIYAQVHSKRS